MAVVIFTKIFLYLNPHWSIATMFSIFQYNRLMSDQVCQLPKSVLDDTVQKDTLMEEQAIYSFLSLYFFGFVCKCLFGKNTSSLFYVILFKYKHYQHNVIPLTIETILQVLWQHRFPPCLWPNGISIRVK